MNIEAPSSSVLNVSVGSTDPLHSLVNLSSVLSDDSWGVVSESIACVSGHGVVSSGPWSDGLGSVIEGPPLLVVHWVVVLDSESVHVSTDVLVPEEGSSAWHS